MLDLLEMQKYFILRHLRPGNTAVDFTLGNGYDTEFLCRTVGATGRVYAFDIQEEAIASARERLSAVDCPKNYKLIHDSHHNIRKYINEPFTAGMFNLGWLPSGDKSITTKRETTLSALSSAISLLAPDGIISLAIYPGHPEGEAEGRLTTEYLTTLERRAFCVTKLKIINSSLSPYFIIIERSAQRAEKDKTTNEL